MDICLSGGAIGADALFGIQALKNNHDLIDFSFSGHKCVNLGHEYILSETELKEGEFLLKQAQKRLNKTNPRSIFVLNLLRRNYWQIKFTDSIFAVCSLKFDLQEQRLLPQGGTGYAVEMGILRGVPDIFLFDQITSSWYRFNYDWITCVTVPKPSGVYTGIGSRKLFDNQRQAIIDLYK